MSQSPSTISLDQAIETVLDRAESHLPWDKFVEKVLALWPSKAKKPATSIRNTLRYDRGRRVVMLGKDTLLPVHLLMNGLRFRITLSQAESEHYAVRIIPWFVPFSVMFHRHTNLDEHLPRFFDENDLPINNQLTQLSMRGENWMGEMETIEVPAFDLSSWFGIHNPQVADSVLVTIKDWKQQEYRLNYEVVQDKRQAAIDHQNQTLADAIYEIVCNHRDDRPYAREVLANAYAQLRTMAYAYPGDHWSEVVENDERLGHLGYQQIGLARYVSYDEDPILLKDPVPAEQERVYTFKAGLKYRKSIWRRIEVQGRNTLGEFDRQMRNAFNHDWDHLSEFYYRPKDRGRYASWEGYGYHPSFDDTKADDIQVAELSLQVGDQLKYVYDFGDWIEHLITLEEITEAGPGTNYPRIVGQNKPRYKYCVSCKEQGRKTKAIWVCIWCSNEEQRDIWLCEECVDTDHSDHYVDEIVY
jgi:hypothetical protein